MPNRQSSSKAQAAQPEAEEPPSPTSSISSSQHQKEVAEELGPSKVPPSQVAKPATPSASSNSQKANTASESTSQPAETDVEAMQNELVPPSPGKESTNPPPKETIMEESIRVTRGRLRKTRSAAR